MAYALNCDPNRTVFAVLNALTGYFDDSGKEDTAAVIACGFVSTVSDWLRFKTEWTKILTLPQFSLPYFHMKEVRNAKWGTPFHKFKNNQPLRDELLGLLGRVISRFSLEGIAGGVDVAAYRIVNTEFQLEERFGPPSVLAGCVAIDRAIRWQQQHSPQWQLEIMFDSGYANWGRLLSEAKAQCNVTPIPGDDKKLPQLQSADFAAWENHRAHGTIIKAGYPTDPSIDFRTTFDKFMERFGDWWMVLNETELRNLCIDNNVPRR